MLEFDWDEENLQHIALHGVTAAEAEYVMNRLTVDLGYRDWHDEDRFSDAGATASGRILARFLQRCVRLFFCHSRRESAFAVAVARSCRGYSDTEIGLVVLTTPRGYKTRVVTAYDAPKDVREEVLRLMVN